MTDASTQSLDDALNAASISPNGGVAESTSRRSWSFTAQVASLDPGGAACRLHRVAADMTIDELAQTLTQLRAQCRNNASPSVRKAAARTGGEYTTEVCEFVSPRGLLYIATIVTRTT